MQLTPNAAFEHIKESVVQYLETAYRISNPIVFAERGEILRRRGTIAQEPFIEATPAFPTAHKLAELERLYPEFLPAGLSELVQHGVPVDRFPLYTHQENALLAAFSDKPSLLVATGTGSGKTEAFVLPILADILNEAQTWAETVDVPRRGYYDAQSNVWLHSRRHEARPAALRAIILYPMNALVNDQLSRLRRILARGASPDWQRRNLRGNVIHFGMYTGLSLPTGSWSEKSRRERFENYLNKLEEDWQKLREDLRDTGGWARPDSPEMLCRWDIQAAPPDIMVTNYSMLEYMLVRPIEYDIFEKTRQWLQNSPNSRITLVLDEAHTYTGAKGTEVAHLIRRLKERLGIEPGSSKFRAIATTASLPNVPGVEQDLFDFAADLVGEPQERFSLIRLPSGQTQLATRKPKETSLHAFAAFHKEFDIQDPMPAIQHLAENLQLGPVDRTEDPQVVLHSLLEKNEDVSWIRQRTARNATLLDQLANECWSNLGSVEQREQATAGLLSAGSYARPVPSTDVPPLLSMRVHAFFRGVSGIWACIDPSCSALPEHLRHPERPVGKLYTDPRPWCDCGARVLELFSCRHCGLLFVGGIPDATHESLWPWNDDLSGERQDIKQFRIFGVEPPHPSIQPDFRSTRTTLPIHPNDPFARRVYEIEKAEQNGEEISPFPIKCPRCQNYRAPGLNGREVIEPLRTKGPQSFSLIVEDGFRVQPRATKGEPPNYGRKALVFSDSRQEAAKLAGDIRTDHARDLFRQLIYRALHSCPTCSGTGFVEDLSPFRIGQSRQVSRKPCPDCQGVGTLTSPSPVGFTQLRRRVIDMQFSRGINPATPLEDFFAQVARGSQTVYQDAEQAFNLALRRELAEDEFALEPLGLASWKVQLPESFGAFEGLDEDETKVFIRAIARILATENILLPPKPDDPWAWPRNSLKNHERQVIIPGTRRQEGAIPYNLQPNRKLGRYVIAVSQALVAAGRLSSNGAAKKWLQDLHWPLWNTLKELDVLQWAGAKINNQVPFGIRIDSFELHPITNVIQQCSACGYVMSETVLNVCLRCGQQTQPVLSDTLRNYYRRAALYALPDSVFDDPYPLRAFEHTAQIQGAEARDLERWFQDLFHDNQNPLDYRVDVLSVTTTMEMGIDIGSLLCVGLRNVPPSVANYQQRAGRAGRRGSAIATVLTFAQQRSHDQYYFGHPPEIVTNPPRVPSLYLQNEVIAQRHIRALVLQSFFFGMTKGKVSTGLFSTWGTIADFANHQLANKLRQFLATNRAPLLARSRKIINEAFHDRLDAWLSALVEEVQDVVNHNDAQNDLLVSLINGGLLPKYAFPVDVVSLSIPSSRQTSNSYDEGVLNDEAMQRDLKIALAEYAPGGEVIRGSFPDTYIYRSAGIYDPFEKKPDYRPTEMVVECLDCQSISLLSLDEEVPVECEECQSPHIMAIPYLRPPGFTVDVAERNAGAERYEGGGRERSGYVAPARLLVGQTAFSGGTAPSFAPNLYSYVRVGDLFVFNKGSDPNFPGFLICPVCGRSLDTDNPGSHTYPANIPPHTGKGRGPRAGTPCPNKTDFRNQVILGHRFHSEVILLGVDLPQTMDAPFWFPSGRAIWYSFGTLLANAAAIVLQVDPGELKVGVRATKRAPGRLHGEVFLYDDVPGGAGYARAIQDNLEVILRKALDLGLKCDNPDCSGACYQCLYDYRNQTLHPLLDRGLGASVLQYLLYGTEPSLSQLEIDRCAANLIEFARANWKIAQSVKIGRLYFPCILEDNSGTRIGLWVIHPLQARPSAAEVAAIMAKSGIRPAVHTSFDLDRRPFWVMNHLISG